MPIRFIIGLVFVVITIIAFLITAALKKTAARPDLSTRDRERANSDVVVGKIVRSICAGITIALILSACVTVVGTRRIGVVTDFGRPVDSMSNGIHIKAPWQQVSELDGSIQTDNYVGGGDEGLCIDIRIGNESTACVDATIRWRIIINEAPQLYRDFRNMDRIRDSLVTRELNASLNAVLGDFNPLDAVNLDDTGSLASLDDLATEVTESVRGRVEGRVEVLSVTLPLIRYDRGTQDRLNEYQEEVANTRIATQRGLTAAEQAEANRALADSVSNDPNVLVARCFEVMQQMVEREQPVPAGFSCWPGGSSGVVIPSAR